MRVRQSAVASMIAALTIAALAVFPAVAHANATIDRVDLLDQALDAIEDGDDARYDELVEAATDLAEPFPTLVIDALVDRDFVAINDTADFLSLDDVEVVQWVIDSIDDEQAAINTSRRSGSTDDRAELREIDETNEAYLFLLRQRGIELSPPIEKVMSVLPPPSSPDVPLPVDYETALNDLRELIGGAAPNAGLEQATSAPRTEPASSGMNPFLPIGIATIGLAFGVFALLRSRRHKEVASTDGLTGLKTRRRFDIDLEERERRGAQPTAMLMIDVDNFKAFNDSHGHSVGDEVLRMVSDAISGEVRKNDVAYRYGGEEFIVLLPNTEHKTAAAVAERIRSAITEIVLSVNASVTVSVGVAAGPSSEVSDTINDADAALYAAKKAGRNRVAVG